MRKNILISITLILFSLFSIPGCQKLPEPEYSSVIRYNISGKEVTTYYTDNYFILETSRTGKNFIRVGSISAEDELEIRLVTEVVLPGVYNQNDSVAGDFNNEITYRSKNGVTFDSGNCDTPSFTISVTAFYELQQTISGSFSGKLCDKAGNQHSLNGEFTFVKRIYY